jgi:uncharacterized membrane protein HdeD (DUF308 family)
MKLYRPYPAEYLLLGLLIAIAAMLGAAGLAFSAEAAPAVAPGFDWQGLVSVVMGYLTKATPNAPALDWHGFLMMIAPFAVTGIASLASAILPPPGASKMWNFVRGVIDLAAANFGNAKNVK